MKYIYSKYIYSYIIYIYYFLFLSCLLILIFFLFTINLIKRNNFLQITERVVLQLDLMSPKKLPPFLYYKLK